MSENLDLLRDAFGAFAENLKADAGMGGTHCTFIVRTPGDPEAEFVITGDPDLEQVQAVLRRSMAREGGAK